MSSFDENRSRRLQGLTQVRLKSVKTCEKSCLDETRSSRLQWLT